MGYDNCGGLAWRSYCSFANDLVDDDDGDYVEI